MLSTAKLKHARKLRDGGEHTMTQIAELVGCSRATLYRAGARDRHGGPGQPVNSIVPFAPVVGAAATTLAAGAAYWSASTSARTARRADATSARAVEALGRATMPG